jgi:hypothetical protein
MRIVRTAALGAAVVMLRRRPSPPDPHASRQQGLLMKSALFTWESVPETNRPTGRAAQRVRRPTATLDELEYHTTTLKPAARRTARTPTRTKS